MLPDPEQNPHAAGLPHSAYHIPGDKGLTHAFNGKAADLRTAHLHHVMKAVIDSPAFPCHGAKAAMKRKSYRFALYKSMDDAQSVEALCHDLYAFAQEQRKMDNNFTTFIVCFEQTPLKDVHDFEDKVWKLLGALAMKDKAHHAWDPLASDNPDNPYFSFSFAETSYFVAALSPVSLRMSRQFVVPALVFNAHYQFEEMKKKGLFDKFKNKIRGRDRELEKGAPNKLVSSFGETTGGTIQYVGAPPKDGGKWQCPFHKYFRR